MWRGEVSRSLVAVAEESIVAFDEIDFGAAGLAITGAAGWISSGLNLSSSASF